MGVCVRQWVGMWMMAAWTCGKEDDRVVGGCCGIALSAVGSPSLCQCPGTKCMRARVLVIATPWSSFHGFSNWNWRYDDMYRTINTWRWASQGMIMIACRHACLHACWPCELAGC